MALISYYATGTATVASGGTAVTGQGTAWLASVKAGDLFWGTDGRSVRIASVETNTGLTLAFPWPGGDRSELGYEIRITPPAAEMQATVRQLLEMLNQGLWLNPDATGTLAERDAYDDSRRGFIYMQTNVDPFLVYVKETDTSGDWSAGVSLVGPEGDPGLQGEQGPATIAIGTVTTGDAGGEAAVANSGTPEDVVLDFTIPRGDQGVAGDMSGANNLSELTDPDVAQDNLGVDDRVSPYKGFENRTTTPGAPASGARIYMQDDRLRAQLPAASHLGSPFILPTFYSGNIQINNSHNWQRIIERHEGGGTITLEDGTYIASGNIKVKGKQTFIKALNQGLAIINGTWDLKAGEQAYLQDLNLLTPADSHLYRGDNAYLDLYDCAVNGQFANAGTLIYVIGGVFRVSAATRDSVWTLTSGVTGQVIDADGASVKFVANTTDKRIKANLSNDAIFALFDMGNGLFTGTHLTGGADSGRGIQARRAARVTLQDDNQFTNLDYGVVSGQGSHIHINQATFTGNGVAIWRTTGGMVTYDKDLVTFVSNTTNIQDDHKTDGAVAGGEPGPSLFEFGTGAASIAAGATAYMGGSVSAAADTTVRVPVPFDCVIDRLYQRSFGGPGSGQTYTFTLQKNGVDTALTAVSPDGFTMATNTVHSVEFSAGQYMTMKVVASAGAIAQAHRVAVRIRER